MKFFSSVENFFKKVFGSANWEQTASTTITLTAPLLETIVAEAGSEADAAEVQAVVTETQNDLAAVATLIKQAKGGTTPTATITNILNSVKTNLGTLLTEGHIKNPETLTKITGIVNTVIGEIEAILQEIPAAA